MRAIGVEYGGNCPCIGQPVGHDDEALSVDPARLDPKKMLYAALDSVQFNIPEVLVESDEVRNKITRKSILTIDKMVFVNLCPDGDPAPHGKTRIKYIEEQFQEDDSNDPK